MKQLIAMLTLLTILLPFSAHAQEITGYTTLTPDSVEIYYETQGEGMPIMIIAGGPGGNPNFYRYTHSDWLEHGRLVYVHNRGRGRSENLDHLKDAYSVEKDVLDIEAVRQSLGAERIIVYGHSYGGTPALMYALIYPRHCHAVITSCTHSGRDSFQKYNIDGMKYFLQRQFPEQWAVFDSLHSAGLATSDSLFEKVWPDISEMYYYDPDNASIMDSIWKLSSDSLSVGFNYMVYLAIVGPDPEWSVEGTLRDVELVPQLNKVECPALIVSGRFDRVCPPIVQKEIADALPNGKLVMFEQSGHRPFIEQKNRFFEISGEFLDSVINKTGGE